MQHFVQFSETQSHWNATQIFSTENKSKPNWYVYICIMHNQNQSLTSLNFSHRFALHIGDDISIGPAYNLKGGKMLVAESKTHIEINQVPPSLYHYYSFVWLISFNIFCLMNTTRIILLCLVWSKFSGC